MAVRYGNLPFREQLDYLREQVAVPTRTWTDIYGAEHDQAFMVAGASRQAIVEDFQRSIRRVIEEGGTIADFRRDFDDIVKRHGWSYRGSRGWRSRLIFETNLMQSYHAGREAQMADPELRRLRPFGLYRHGGSDDPRPEHLAHDGKVVPLDDPWWDVWSPKNGWGCSCKKYMISREQAEREGYTVSEQGPEIDWEERTVGENGPSPRTVRVPRGIDPGFEHRPGSGRGRALSPSPLGTPAGRPGRSLPARRAGDPLPDYRDDETAPFGADQAPEAYVDDFLAAFGTRRGGDAARFEDAVGEPLAISDALFDDGRGGVTLPGVGGRELAMLAETLRRPDEIWTALDLGSDDDQRPRLRRRYLARLVLPGGEEGLVLVDWGRDGWSGQRLEDLDALNEWRQGVRLYRRGEED
ncbi:PBECR2 nuclease fold domain-containing protein [Billgrantia gudaonensis]|uniref:Phage Mu protein F like protein n=1 Tax=Billgrantia gudaonensis TaxID=376427 RepID=A0A1G9AWC9_9GAMM|nr:PBECR2 nuclease fold domain-containing protein [Halomonas gudaonensis]SDK31669.1 Phage Mu protein F like protein [Halomonas gudaonensis]